MSKLPMKSAGRGDLTFSPEAYIDQRAEQYADWYDSKAIKAKRAFLRSRVIIALGAILTPFLASQDFPMTVWGHSIDACNLAGTLVGLLVAVLVACEGILKYQEQWKNYRTTEQYVRTQIVMFCNGVGEFDGLEAEAGFKRFVANIEAAIKNENEITLNVLTRVSGAEGVTTSVAA